VSVTEVKVFGFLINLPIVSYFEVGAMLTPNTGFPSPASDHPSLDV